MSRLLYTNCYHEIHYYIKWYFSTIESIESLDSTDMSAWLKYRKYRCRNCHTEQLTLPMIFPIFPDNENIPNIGM